MSDKNSLQDNLKTRGMKFATKINDHRFIFILIIVGVAIAFSLLKTRTILDVTRNEERYTEELVGINYKEIDTETLESFRLAEQDASVEVNSNFDPDRSNPFTE